MLSCFDKDSYFVYFGGKHVKISNFCKYTTKTSCISGEGLLQVIIPEFAAEESDVIRALGTIVQDDVLIQSPDSNVLGAGVEVLGF